MLFDKSLDIANLGVREPKVGSESNWLQPKLHFIIAARDMNMRRLVILAAVKVKTIRPNSQDGRHGSSCGNEYDVSTDVRNYTHTMLTVSDSEEENGVGALTIEISAFDRVAAVAIQ